MNIFNYRRCGIIIAWIGGKIMLCERKEGKFKGYFGVAGGKIEKNEDVLDGVRREFYEETGAYLHNGFVRFLDCHVSDSAKRKVFIFESKLPQIFWKNYYHLVITVKHI